MTGAAGFIGSNFVDAALAAGHRVIALDKLNYCGNLKNLGQASLSEHFQFICADVADTVTVKQLFADNEVDAIVHFAAQTHVDRSIKDPSAFIEDNVVATQRLLEVSLQYWEQLEDDAKLSYRHIHISTDEVFGDLTDDEAPFTESSPYRPNSPYSASKASADMFVRAYEKTYGLPTVIIHPSNNYGPRQFPEKLIPFMLQRALSGQTLPIYGTGLNQRDWLHVSDHCRALLSALRLSQPGDVFNVGSGVETSNLVIVHTICRVLDRLVPKSEGSYADQITFVADRPGHDWRYVLNTERARKSLGFQVSISLEEGLEDTIKWYLNHPDWMEHVLNGQYRQWVNEQYEGLK